MLFGNPKLNQTVGDEAFSLKTYLKQHFLSDGVNKNLYYNYYYNRYNRSILTIECAFSIASVNFKFYKNELKLKWQKNICFCERNFNF